MRSLKYLAALLPLHSVHVLANKPDLDIVRVTKTNTVTVCPITEWFTCEADLPTISSSHDGGPATTTSNGHDGGWGTSSVTSGAGPDSTSSGHGGWGSSSYTGSTSGDHDNHGTSSSHYGSSSTTEHHGDGTTTSHSAGSTSSSDHHGDGTTTSHSAGTTSTTEGHGDGSTTSSHSTTTSATTSATTSTSCAATVSTEISIATPECNSATSRKQWCRGKSINDDTHEVFFTGQTKKYTLTITEEFIDFDGTPKRSYAINGKSPGEAIVANWGDIVEVTVVNGLTDNATTIHWHGIRQTGTNDQDGVPGVTECGIAPGASRTYEWHASTYGTGWYHSHAMAQYGGGMRGPIIIHGPATADYDYDLGTVMIDETFSQSIFQMAYNIARARGPLPPSTNYLLNGKNKSPDGTTGESAQWVVKKGKKHLFRIINSSAQSGFAVRFDNHKIKVISADFTPVVPYETEVLWTQPGQRYNVILEANQPEGAYFLRAVSQTGCGATSLNDGLKTSNGIFTYEGHCGTPTAANGTNVTITTAGDCKDEPLASLIPHVKKNAGSIAKFQETAKLLPGGNAAAQNFDGHGSIIRWYLGGASDDVSTNSGTPAGTKGINVTYEAPTLKTLSTLPSLEYNSSIYSNAVVLDGPKDSWVYFVIQNNFQTSHPMHLHGHDFSVLGQGKGVFTSDMAGSLNFDNPIRRDTALLFGGGSPTAFVSGWTVIGFVTDNPGAWVMHCHLMWHADGGMGLQYLERPKEIKDYYDSEAFQGECKSYENYIANGGAQRNPYEAGIKKRHLEGHRYLGHSHGGVVRH